MNRLALDDVGPVMAFVFIFALAVIVSGCSADFSTGFPHAAEMSEIDAGSGGIFVDGHIQADTGGKTSVPGTGGLTGTGGAVRMPGSGGLTGTGDKTVVPGSGGSGGGADTSDAQVSPPSDGAVIDRESPAPDACAGCVDSAGVCRPGDTRDACGNQGGPCDDCASRWFLDTMNHSALYCAAGFVAAFSLTCEAGACKKNSFSCCTKQDGCAI